LKGLRYLKTVLGNGIKSRVGRIGLYYQTLNGSDSGYWDRAAGDWMPLDGGDRLAIRQGLRVARQAVAPELLRLRVPAPTADRP